MKITVYKNVYSRETATQFDFSDMICNQSVIFKHFGVEDYGQLLDNIYTEKDKTLRNEYKRRNLPAADISNTGLLAIDIDNIRGEEVKSVIIAKLKSLKSTYLLMDSVSGNLVAYFKYDCSVKDFPFLYYKLYLELTLLLSINIDFLPEIGRLRYISMGTVHHVNEDSEVITEVLRTESLPYINTQVGVAKSRKLIYGSR